ncbi:MAG: L-threonylcarbamoyladenylate synthase [Chloroflexi bacterium]|nr:L-threonylcarbamoyladenylate synthase [Chloroflexota bacterium]
MITKALDADHLSDIAVAADILRTGGLVAYPTDTLYGLGARCWLPEAIAKIFVAKGRAENRPLPLLLAESADMLEVAQSIPIAAWRLAAVFWPGALTIVLPKHPRVPDIVTAAGPTVAVRVPDHAIAVALIRAVGAPIAGTSANKSGGPPPLDAGEVAAQLGGRIDAILDGGRCPGGVESTVLDLSGELPRLLRRGAVDVSAIEDVLERTIVC